MVFAAFICSSFFPGILSYIESCWSQYYTLHCIRCLSYERDGNTGVILYVTYVSPRRAYVHNSLVRYHKLMFSLFLNDIEMHLQENINIGITIDQVSIYLLLFANDAVLISEDAQGLQQMLDSLHGYCNKWSSTVNVDKTKILVFRKGRRLPQNSRFSNSLK